MGLIRHQIITMVMAIGLTALEDQPPSVFDAFKENWLQENVQVSIVIKELTYFQIPVQGQPRKGSRPLAFAKSVDLYIPKHRDGFFCIQERKIEKKSGTALRMRIGTLEDVDRLEGKGRPY